ncbi:DUF397 domain-containing protein [Nocardiopsis tropica]|uniref:DUF397 domain-containing protein n=1 Tax=Nocardiopsis tropica TaxID=109330 RepID=UPI002E7B122D|nr:DUF397 domain-containing protein [Nocardiopsis umidischolae]
MCNSDGHRRRESGCSVDQVGDCTGPAPQWRKSSYSGSQGGNCVEVAESGRHMRLRDSENPGLGHFSFRAEAWSAFLRAAGRD